jgi:NAD-dependent epimerase/dehydratase
LERNRETLLIERMKKILITGAGSYVGESVRRYILAKDSSYRIDAVDTMGDNWKKADYAKYDVVFHVAGIAHVNADPKMEPLYYKVNCNLTIEVAKHAKAAGVRQFIFMSSQIVFHESQSLKAEVLTAETKPVPNGFYGNSKLQAENGLWNLVKNQKENSTRSQGGNQMKICILRPCMIYGPNAKGNFSRLAKLACKTPVFPEWHNKRSMLYIDNLAEFVKQAIERELEGTFYPQNRELADTVEIVRYFAKEAGHKIWITKLLNPFVWMGSLVLQPINKMFATYYYNPKMSKMEFDYQLVSFEESLKQVADSLK